MISAEVKGVCGSTGSGYSASGGTESLDGGGGKNDLVIMVLFSLLVLVFVMVPSRFLMGFWSCLCLWVLTFNVFEPLSPVLLLH